jgi:hypothetical protein
MNEGGLWKQSISVCRSSMRGNWREGSVLGTPKDMPIKALEMDVRFHGGPVLGNMGMFLS